MTVTKGYLFRQLSEQAKHQAVEAFKASAQFEEYYERKVKEIHKFLLTDWLITRNVSASAIELNDDERVVLLGAEFIDGNLLLEEVLDRYQLQLLNEYDMYVDIEDLERIVFERELDDNSTHATLKFQETSFLEDAEVQEISPREGTYEELEELSFDFNGKILTYLQDLLNDLETKLEKYIERMTSHLSLRVVLEESVYRFTEKGQAV